MCERMCMSVLGKSCVLMWLHACIYCGSYVEFSVKWFYVCVCLCLYAWVYVQECFFWIGVSKRRGCGLVVVRMPFIPEVCKINPDRNYWGHFRVSGGLVKFVCKLCYKMKAHCLDENLNEGLVCSAWTLAIKYSFLSLQRRYFITVGHTQT